MKKIVLLTFKKIISYIWNHITRRKKLRKNIVKRIEKTKQKMKKRYDVNVKQQKYFFEQIVFFKNSNSTYNKTKLRWNKSFVITNFDEKHKFNYKFKIFENKLTFNTHHENQLRIFRERIEYLRKINEKKLSIMKNLKKKNT